MAQEEVDIKPLAGACFPPWFYLELPETKTKTGHSVVHGLPREQATLLPPRGFQAGIQGSGSGLALTIVHHQLLLLQAGGLRGLRAANSQQRSHRQPAVVGLSPAAPHKLPSPWLGCSGCSSGTQHLQCSALVQNAL